MKIAVYNNSGQEIKQIELADDVFAVPMNTAVVHQTVVAQRNNARQGTSSTKNRSMVKGSTRKLFRQKGTGNARMGSITNPLRRSGGTIFGPAPRDYSQSINKKMRRLAIRCVLSDKARNGDLKVVETLNFEAPKTKDMVAFLTALNVINRSALVATGGVNENVVKSARNIQKVTTTPANLLNVYDIITHRTLIVTEEAVRQMEVLWGSKAE
ncbi:MAG: 50S ribosomal protein L4 [Chloroflexi bacterium]|nr:50S ribosomal protein L4 [Chloroflexota bacterium]